MKTSDVPIIQSHIREIEACDQQTKAIAGSTTVKFSDVSQCREYTNQMYSLSDSIGSQIKKATLLALEERKAVHIKHLMDKFGVAYDGP